MSVLGRFVLGNYFFAFLLTEQARDRFLVNVPPSYARLATPYLGSMRNVREALGRIGIIETTNFELVDSSSRDISNRATDDHVGRSGPGGDWVYYDPF